MRIKIILIGIFSLCFSVVSAAEPSVLSLDKKYKNSSPNALVNKVHKEIEVSGKSLSSIKADILEGMLSTRGYRWAFEGEGDGFVLARFDYRGDTNIMRIEYNESLVQLKYDYAYGDFVCENLVESICYKNRRGYYNYIKNLRASIAQQLSL